MADSQPHIVIVGGAYGGISALNSLITYSTGTAPSVGKGGPPGMAMQEPPKPARALRTKPRYTILDERDGFYHTVGAPLGQLNTSYAKEFWLPYADVLKEKAVNEDVRFVQGAASSLDPVAKRLTYVSPEKKEDSIPYDFLILATGMRRAAPVVPQAVHETSHLQDVATYVKPLEKASRIVLVGGGAVGIEMSAEAKHLYPHAEVILIHSRSELLSNEPLPPPYKAKALEILREEGVIIRFNTRVLSSQNTPNGISLSLSNNDSLSCDRVIYTAQQRGGNTDFLPKQFKDSLDEKDCILVRPTLQFPTTIPNSDTHYAIGDVASWPHIKRSGPAQNMGKFAASNIISSLLTLEDGKGVEEAQLTECPKSDKPTMSLAIGEQAMSLRGGNIVWGREVKQRAFGRGLGIDGTLQKLGIKPKVVAEEGLGKNGIEVRAAPVAANM